ncbi:hypothetical protein GOODEAATRI_025846 [Goodea atripinnis]|uniref:Uncharacterized protein n=1 Tax=Goodea atripinnis TaxID=208336 RepID=A0ABV0N4B8_9TELE
MYDCLKHSLFVTNLINLLQCEGSCDFMRLIAHTKKDFSLLISLYQTHISAPSPSRTFHLLSYQNIAPPLTWVTILHSFLGLHPKKHVSVMLQLRCNRILDMWCPRPRDPASRISNQHNFTIAVLFVFLLDLTLYLIVDPN